MRRIVFAATLAALLLAGCGGDADEPVGSAAPGMAMCAQGVTDCVDTVVTDGGDAGTDPDQGDAAMTDDDQRARAQQLFGVPGGPPPGGRPRRPPRQRADDVDRGLRHRPPDRRARRPGRRHLPRVVRDGRAAGRAGDLAPPPERLERPGEVPGRSPEKSSRDTDPGTSADRAHAPNRGHRRHARRPRRARRDAPRRGGHGTARAGRRDPARRPSTGRATTSPTSSPTTSSRSGSGTATPPPRTPRACWRTRS